MFSIRTSHKLLWTFFAVGLFLMILGDTWNLFWSFLLITVGLHFLFNLLFSIKVLKHENFQAVLGPVAKNESSSPEILAAIFKDDMGAKDLVLPVFIKGKIQSRTSTRTPWTKKDVTGWSLDVWLYKKSLFGGASDYTPLVSQSHFEPFTFDERGNSVFVDEPGIVRGVARKDQMLTWSALEGAKDVKNLVEEKLKISGLSKDGTTGVRIVETWFGNGAVMTAWGQASFGNDGKIHLSGTDQKGDPKALIVAGANVSVQNGIGGTGLTILNAAIVTVLFAFGLTWAVSNFWTLEKEFPWLNAEKVGKVHYKGDGEAWEVRLETLNLDNTLGWNLGAEDISVDLTDNDVKAIVKSSTELVLRRPKVLPFTLMPNSKTYLVEKSDGYHLTLVDREPEAISLPARNGQFYVFNRSDQSVELRFLSSTASLDGLYWTMNAHVGENLPWGIQLLKKKNPIVLGQSDVVKIRPVNSTVDQMEVLGNSKIVRWNSEKQAWIFEMKDDLFRSIPPVLFVSNPFGFEVKIHVMDGQGKETKGDWTLNAHWGGANGAVLKKDKFVFEPGDWIVVEPLDYLEIYRGPISGYQGASWNKDIWSISPVKDR